METAEFQSRLEAAHNYDWFVLLADTVKLEKSSAREYSAACPICGGTDRFHLNLDKGYFCRRCTGGPEDGGWHDQIDYRMWLFGEDFNRATSFFYGGKALSREDLAQIAAERTRREKEERAAQVAKQESVRTQLDQSGAWKNYADDLRHNAAARDLWRARGLPDDWQDYYGLGYCGSREFMAGKVPFTTETITIPYFETRNNPGGDPTYHVVGLVHRLLKPYKDGDKYRPHMSGAGKAIYRADYIPVGLEKNVLLVEGEIKAMVTYMYLHDTESVPIFPNLSVVATAGANMKPELLSQFDNCERIFICLDPDAHKETMALAIALGKDRCNTIYLPGKIDDLLIAGALTGLELAMRLTCVV